MSANSKPAPPITLHKWLVRAAGELAAANIPTSRLDAEILLAHVLETGRSWLHAHGDEVLDHKVEKRATKLLNQRIQRIPIAYLTGHKEFYGRDFIVTPDVLIPRPETETLIELAKELHLGGQLLDVGTGSGCIGLTLALENGCAPTLSDVSPAALAVTRQNAETLKINATLIESNLLNHWLTREVPPFDIITANLPYVDRAWERSKETDHEPVLALFADDHGLALIFQLITQTPRVLRSGGFLLLEADPEQHPAIIDYAQQNGLVPETVRDYIIALRKV